MSMCTLLIRFHWKCISSVHCENALYFQGVLHNSSYSKKKKSRLWQFCCFLFYFIHFFKRESLASFSHFKFWQLFMPLTGYWLKSIRTYMYRYMHFLFSAVAWRQISVPSILGEWQQSLGVLSVWTHFFIGSVGGARTD